MRDAWRDGVVTFDGKHYQTDGAIDLKSRFRDTLTADFDGTDVTGEVTMNGVEYTFSAASVSGVAGMYTAESDGVRASWVVRPDRSAVGEALDDAAASTPTVAVYDKEEFADTIRDQVNQLLFMIYGLLALAMRSLPLGTAYTVWTGIGAVGAFVLGVLLLGEGLSPGRVLAAALIVAGIAMMKLSSP